MGNQFNFFVNIYFFGFNAVLLTIYDTIFFVRSGQTFLLSREASLDFSLFRRFIKRLNIIFKNENFLELFMHKNFITRCA